MRTPISRRPVLGTPPVRLPPRSRRRWGPGVLACLLWALAVLDLAAAAWLDHLLRQAGRPDLAVVDASSISVAAVHIGLATVGAVVASRRPRHPVGWLLLLTFGVLGNASFVVAGYADYGLLVRPGTLPAAWLVARYFPATAATAFACLGFVLLLTPTGSLPSPRWRWWAIPTVAITAGLLLTVALAPGQGQIYLEPKSPFDLHDYHGALLVAYQVAYGIILLAVAVAAASLVVRFRRASGIERQQLRWVALGAALIALLLVVMMAAVAIGVPGTPDPGLVGTAALAILMLGIGAATLRYRLYDLDRIISRTLSYGLLTLLLAGGYAAVVLALGQFVGRQSSLVVALATLAVAALFRPARRRVQDLVDRRFNRRRYDAARTIETFAARVRQQVDLDSLTAELLTVVERTMQPTQASLWMRPTTPHARRNR